MKSLYVKYVLLTAMCLGVVGFALQCAQAADESLLDVLERPASTAVYPMYTYPVLPILPQQPIVPTTPVPVLPVAVTPPAAPAIPMTPPLVPTITPTTEITQKTCEMLRPVTVLGTRSQAVTAIQDVLRAEGYFSQASTGYYGSVTAQAVRSFQAAYKIRTTGLVGDITYKKLVERCVEGLLRQNSTNSPMPTPVAPGSQTPAAVLPTLPQQPVTQTPTTPITPTNPLFPYQAPAPTVTTSPGAAAIPPAPFATPSNEDLSEAETYGINRGRAIAPASTCTAEVLTGDIEPVVGGDRDVDIWDLLQITRNYNKPVNLSTNARADIVADGIVDFKDLVIVVQQFSRRACN